MREDVDEDLAMTSHATAQRPGDRAFQRDATAVFTAPDGTRAYALLDGVGDTPAVRSWTRTASLRLARAAAESAREHVLVGPCARWWPANPRGPLAGRPA
ncbi:hypothetical protein [Streptomyces eurythermus]|uniref:hypothetical protein n=1 Tax=Streptomyces eurythermus TaxID=42237 RepID=UPI0033C68647